MFQGIGPAEPEQPQYYQVACPEGHILRGTRTEGYQALRCPTCGEGIFILPRSPLPEPPRGVDAATRRRGSREAEPEVEAGPIPLVDPPPQALPVNPDIEIEWEEEVAAPAAQPSPSHPDADGEREPVATSSRPAAVRPATVRKAQPAKQPTRRPPEVAKPVVEPIVPAGASARRWTYRNRHVLALAGVALLIAGTYGVRQMRARWQDLPQLAKASREEGMAALEKGEFDVAKLKLSEAAGALERLRDEEAGRVRQQAEESAILADLASASLEEIVEEVATRPDGRSKFDSLHRGRSIVVDARIAALPRGSDGMELDYKILAGAGGRPRRGRLDLNGFRLFEGSSKRVGDPVLFGARLAAVSLGEDGAWLVSLEPDSGVLISTPEGLKALLLLGWPPPDQPEEPR
jgi:hypothetical protein